MILALTLFVVLLCALTNASASAFYIANLRVEPFGTTPDGLKVLTYSTHEGDADRAGNAFAAETDSNLAGYAHGFWLRHSGLDILGPRAT